MHKILFFFFFIIGLSHAQQLTIDYKLTYRVFNNQDKTEYTSSHSVSSLRHDISLFIRGDSLNVNDYLTDKTFTFKNEIVKDENQLKLVNTKPFIVENEFKVDRTELIKISDFVYKIIVYKTKKDKKPMILKVFLEKSDDNLISYLPLDLNPNIVQIIFQNLNDQLLPNKFIVKRAEVLYESGSEYIFNLLNMEKINYVINLPQ
ncbi:hypothetical protein [Halpernia frigidisoli]|uniref:Uncharacterized protein n=1 Tax=Halpernia frigidisoli TaxID=1125876 RepID=A0A1I3DX65_9FLAO|nr:hypothetical protein [Halpernia frigidisoli]SFH91223.1 hypothetical protein SAMN05443292_0750 [Halpernia frigidisoli]